MERALIDLIRNFGSASPDKRTILSIGDDCAVLKPSTDTQLVVTTDTLEEGVHFNFEYFSPYDLGIKAAAVNLSDIAAMGARPKWAFLNLSLKPKCMNEKWVKAFIKGLSTMLTSNDTVIAGGDTVASSSAASITLTVIGEIEPHRALLRSGASPGDIIYCSGFTGESGAGLSILSNPGSSPGMGRIAKKRLVKRHLHPIPRLSTGRILSEKSLASSATDISDGIATDLANICSMSGVSAVLHAPALPFSRALKTFCRKIDTKTARKYAGLSHLPLHLSFILSAGEDFELLWTTPPETEKECVKTISRNLGRRPFRIGEIRDGKGAFLDYRGMEIDITYGGYEH